MTGASFGAFLLPIVARPFLSPVAASSVFAGSLLLEPVPAYFLDWKTGLAFSATQLGLLGMAALSSAALQLDALANFFFANFSSIGLYSTSIIYKLSSANQAPVVEMASPQPDNLMVFFSPFNWRNLLHPINLFPVLYVAVSLLVFPIPNGTPVWTTGGYQFGNATLPAAAGIPLMLGTTVISQTILGVAEEAVFGGIFYQEFKRALGPVWSRVLDSTTFAALHVFGDVASGNSARDILVAFAMRIGMGLYAEWAFDVGGLPLAATTHMLTNFLLYSIQNLLVGGAPPAAGGSLLAPMAQCGTYASPCVFQLSLATPF